MIFSDYNFKKSQEQIDFERECSKARAKAISFIGISKKASKKISGWLKEKGYPDSVISEVIQELIDEKVIDDEEFARKVLKKRQGRYAESKMALEHRLTRIGIPRDIAIKCIDESFIDSNKEENDAALLLSLKFSSKVGTIHQWDYEERKKFQHKCYRFLMGRGYSFRISYIATKNLMNENFLEGDQFE